MAAPVLGPFEVFEIAVGRSPNPVTPKRLDNDPFGQSLPVNFAKPGLFTTSASKS